jgi:hypothetical protein
MAYIFITFIILLANHVSCSDFESVKPIICLDLKSNIKGQKSATSDVTIYKEYNLVKKHVREYLNYGVFEREIATLLKLKDFDHVPKLVAVDVNNHDIYMEYAGEPVKKETIPVNWREQVKEIIDGLRKRGIQHNDIKNAEILMKDGKIMIIDYGWASTYGQAVDPSWPRGLGSSYKSPAGFDDRYSLIKVLLAAQRFPEEPTVAQINDEIIAIFGKL